MEASLTCAVCLSVFRDPVTLPLCSHNFCKSCVLECGEPQPRTVHFSIHTGNISVPGQVTCPLCRKVSSIPGGLSTLPVNTTLAELVRLMSLSGGVREQGAMCGQEADISERGAVGHCPDHPEHKLELFCKNCAVACCGKCVSCNHQGIFHNVNLLDMVYQEEKLRFFNRLKKLREMHEKFTSSTSDDAKDIKDQIRKNAETAILAFNQVFKTLELKKLQCLELIKQQQNTTMKRYEVRKKATAHHRITVESLLKDCENLVDEYDPKCFLQVACSLNKRMTSTLDLMELTASHDQDVVSVDPVHVDLKAVLDAISAVKFTACTSNVSQTKFKGISFQTVAKICKQEQTPTKKYSPVQSQELCYLHGQIQKMATRLLSITEMPEYKHLSFEELRMKDYEDVVIQDSSVSLPENQDNTLPNNEDIPILGTDEASGLNAKIRKSDFPAACSTIKIEQGTVGNAESEMEFAEDPPKECQDEAAFKFPTCASVRAKEPVNCSLKEVASGVSLDKTEVTTNKQETLTRSKTKIARVPVLKMDAQNKAVFVFPTCVSVRAKEPVNCSLKEVASGASLDKSQEGTEDNTNKQETITRSKTKMVSVEEPQNDAQNKDAFMFPSIVTVRAKEPVICALEGAVGGVSLDDEVQNETDVVKETNTKVVANFCFGKYNAADLSKHSKSPKSWKKPKTGVSFQTTAANESINKSFTFSFNIKTDSKETKTDLSSNPLSQPECKAQGNEGSEDNAAQSSSCEEFYDASSDADETEQASPSNSTGQ
ncbi:uncharacterized protein [Pyxicephalus adspersus]|uniref:uncharacterized protein isoform X2 n=1 Tax=Pyxicephalus adspersus TaxID=30357 RepID=UPI003B5930B2